MRYRRNGTQRGLANDSPPSPAAYGAAAARSDWRQLQSRPDLVESVADDDVSRAAPLTPTFTCKAFEDIIAGTCARFERRGSLSMG